jgi:hypothetical protein
MHRRRRWRAAHRLIKRPKAKAERIEPAPHDLLGPVGIADYARLVITSLLILIVPKFKRGLHFIDDNGQG